MRMNKDREWLKEKAMQEDGCFVGAGAREPLNTKNGRTLILTAPLFNDTRAVEAMAIASEAMDEIDSLRSQLSALREAVKDWFSDYSEEDNVAWLREQSQKDVPWRSHAQTLLEVIEE